MIAPRRPLPLIVAAMAALILVACEQANRGAADSGSNLDVALETPQAVAADGGGRGGIGGGSGTGAGGGGGIGGVNVGSSPGPHARQAAPQRRAAAGSTLGNAFGTGSGAGTGAGAEETLQGTTRAAVETTSVAQSAMLIRTGHASIEVDTLERAIAAVQVMARRLGGYVANTNLQVGERQPRRADLQLRFPSSRFDEATSALQPIGKVETLVINTDDVGEEYVDMTARMTNARRLEERLIDLLARRTGKLEDMLAVERELARVREEIERYEGRLRFLRSRASVSTLSLTVHEPAPVFEPRPGPSRIGEAFREAWRNFVGFLAALISALGWLVPLAAIGGGIVWAGRRLLPRRPAPTPEPEPAPRPTPMPGKRDAA